MDVNNYLWNLQVLLRVLLIWKTLKMLLHLKRLEVGLWYTETKNNIRCKYSELQTYHRFINQISNRAVWSKLLLTSHFCSALELTRLSFGDLYKAAHRYLCLVHLVKLDLTPRFILNTLGRKTSWIHRLRSLHGVYKDKPVGCRGIKRGLQTVAYFLPVPNCKVAIKALED